MARVLITLKALQSTTKAKKEEEENNKTRKKKEVEVLLCASHAGRSTTSSSRLGHALRTTSKWPSKLNLLLIDDPKYKSCFCCYFW